MHFHYEEHQTISFSSFLAYLGKPRAYLKNDKEGFLRKLNLIP